MPIDAIHRFNRRCHLAALAAIFILTAAGLFLRFDRYDFPQYDQAALVARERAWEGLYPIPHANSAQNPGETEDSDYRPQYEVIREKYGAFNGPRYIHPPPMALLLLPLAFLSPAQAHIAWLIFLALCAWGVAIEAGRFYEMLDKRPSRIAGWLTLGAACSPAMLFSVRIANLLPVTALCLALAVRELAQRDGWRGGFALFGSIISKYAGLVLLPIYLLRGRWRTLAWCAAASMALLLVSLTVMGTGPFHTYFSEIFPLMGRPVSQAGNHSLEGMLLRITGRAALTPAVAIAFHVTELLTLLLVLWAILRRRRELRSAPRLLPAAAALILWMLIFAPVSWYQVYLIPFWGWMIWEMRRGGATAKILGAIAIGLGCLSVSMRPVVKLPEPLATYGLLSMVAGLVLAMASLLAAQGSSDRVAHPDAEIIDSAEDSDATAVLKHAS